MLPAPAKEEPAAPFPKLETAKAVSAAELIIDAMLNAELEEGAEAAPVAPAATEGGGESKGEGEGEGEGEAKAVDENAGPTPTYGERFRAAPTPKQKVPKKPRMKWGAPTSRILRKILNPGAKDFVEKKEEEPATEQVVTSVRAAA